MTWRTFPWWALTALLPFGWFTWIGVAYAAVRARVWWWLGLAAVLLGMVVWGLAIPTEDDAGGVVIAGWLLGVGVCAVLAPLYVRRMRSMGAEAKARARVESRLDAQRLARDEPEVARELGVGRPWVTGAQHHGLVDVNEAPVDVLSRLAGVDDAQATEIARVREEIDGFGSVEELGHLLDLPGDAVEDLRPRVVFLPR